VPQPPLILVTNDDGIRSPGLRAAAEAVAGLGELLVLAPATQQTSMTGRPRRCGHSLADISASLPISLDHFSTSYQI
jgi:5'/3'-nucleotidase SurE